MLKVNTQVITAQLALARLLKRRTVLQKYPKAVEVSLKHKITPNTKPSVILCDPLQSIHISNQSRLDAV